MALKPPVDLLELLFPLDPPVRSMTLGLRQVVLEELAPCHEYILSMGKKLWLLNANDRISGSPCLTAPDRIHVGSNEAHGPDYAHPPNEKGFIRTATTLGRGRAQISLRINPVGLSRVAASPHTHGDCRAVRA
jgi:hypothetical protein